VANLLWTQGNAGFVCQTMDPTCNPQKTWDCETCIQDILDMNNAMATEAVATEFSNLLGGPSLCENPEYPFDEEGILWCQATVAEFIPKALPVLFDPPNGVEDIQMVCSM